MNDRAQSLSDRLESAAVQRAREAFDAAMREPWRAFADSLGAYVGANAGPTARLAVQARIDTAFDAIKAAALPGLESHAVERLASAIEAQAAAVQP